MKVCNKCGDLIDGRDGDNLCGPCDRGEQKKRKAAQARRERDEALKSLGLIKVRGARGGTYWE